MATELPTTGLFSDTGEPPATVTSDGVAYELGVKFAPSVDGYIVALQYYRTAVDADDTDTRSAHLWAADGTLLGEAEFVSAPGASGWQLATLDTPIAVTAGTQYVASYSTENFFIFTNSFFSASYSAAGGLLTAPEDSASGGNGVFNEGAGGFPAASFGARNYWIDVVLAYELFTEAADTRELDTVADLAARADSETQFALGGDDVVTLSSTAKLGVNFYSGEGGDTITGGSATDRIRGDAGNDVLTGSGGDDYLYGGGDDDTLISDAGIDRLFGGDGDDTIIARGGRPIGVFGGGGADTTIVEVFAGATRLKDFDPANDVIDLRPLLASLGYVGSDPVADNWIRFTTASNGDAKIRIDVDGPGAGTAPFADVVVVEQRAVSDLVIGDNLLLADPVAPLFTEDADALDLGTVADLAARADSGTQFALGGDDVVTLSSTAKLGVNFYAGEGGDTITGGSATDRIRGDAGNDVLTGNGGDDYLYGGGDDDTLISDAGIDRLFGGDGDDTIIARGGTPTGVFGDAGADTTIVEVLAGLTRLKDFEADEDVIDLRPLLASIGYAGSDPVGDGYIRLIAVANGDTRIRLDVDGPGTGTAPFTDVVVVEQRPVSDLVIGDNLLLA